MNYNYDHERFVAKNRALASAENIRDYKKGEYGYGEDRSKNASCFTCKFKSTCTTFKAKKSGGASGVVSIGGEESFICERYIKAPSAEERKMSDKQIKALLKNIKKGY
ncbi:MAG: hypothetical protein N2053_11265 [Chitinispirillaceae bacterium]|nr:hypothetical protein [Chitinispirillaceae bacterium]